MEAGRKLELKVQPRECIVGETAAEKKRLEKRTASGIVVSQMGHRLQKNNVKLHIRQVHFSPGEHHETFDPSQVIRR